MNNLDLLNAEIASCRYFYKLYRNDSIIIIACIIDTRNFYRNDLRIIMKTESDRNFMHRNDDQIHTLMNYPLYKCYKLYICHISPGLVCMLNIYLILDLNSMKKQKQYS